jgi:phage terminase large subunit-like protein
VNKYLFLILLFFGGFAFAQDLGGAVTVINEGVTQTKSIAAAIVVLLSSLLAIGLVVMLYIKVSDK